MEKLEMANFFHTCILVIFQIATVRCVVHRGYNSNLNSNRSSRRISPVTGRFQFWSGQLGGQKKAGDFHKISVNQKRILNSQF